VEHGTLVGAPIGIDAGTWLAWRQLQSHSSMSGRRVRVRNPRRRTIIGPIIAPSVLGRPHMMRHRDLPLSRWGNSFDNDLFQSNPPHAMR
jgi:hypothetical protein